MYTACSPSYVTPLMNNSASCRTVGYVTIYVTTYNITVPLTRDHTPLIWPRNNDAWTDTGIYMLPLPLYMLYSTSWFIIMKFFYINIFRDITFNITYNFPWPVRIRKLAALHDQLSGTPGVSTTLLLNFRKMMLSGVYTTRTKIGNHQS